MFNKPSFFICLLLGAITLGLYWPAHSFDFLRFDDNDYVTQNTQVQAGLTRAGIAWAFQSNYASNWHPLTWISHMLDCQLYGLDPSGHHLTNILFHAANVMLLFLVLNRMTGAAWLSGIVAALFGWHPAHVESVAWVSERKDVLSTFFGLLTLLVYARHAEKPKAGWYLLALFFFSWSLLSKPMLVTLPCLLLLLDYWPLRRIYDGRRTMSDSKDIAIESLRSVPLAKLIAEKIPFFLLSALSCMATVWAQRKGGAVMSFEMLPLAERFKHTPVSYVEYLKMAFWPTRLAAFYPHPAGTPVERMVLAVVLLAGIGIAAIILARRAPYLAVGFFWFLGTLVPVIGLVQVGSQSLADRYSYFPFVGLFIGAVWALAELWQRQPALRAVLNAGAVVLLGGCFYLTSVQLQYWRNTYVLFDHARQVTDRNYIAYSVLGGELARDDRFEEALDHLKTALSYNPAYPGTYFCLGDTYFKLGKYDEAITNLHEATRLAPSTIEAYNEAGTAYVMEGKLSEAETEFSRALQADSTSRRVRLNLGLVYVNEGKWNEAVSNLSIVLAEQPDSVKAHLALAKALFSQGKLAESVPHFEKALQQKPDDAEAQQKLGMALLALGRMDEAGDHFEQAARLNPLDSLSEFQLGTLCEQKGKIAEAVEHYGAVLKYQPDHAGALNNLAWIRAANQKAEFRNGGEAVQLAQRACEATQNREPLLLGTLAAAYAEDGQFSNAITAATQARDLAQTQGKQTAADENEKLLRLYQSGHAYHEEPESRTAK